MGARTSTTDPQLVGVGLALASMTTIQFGISLSPALFDAVGPAGIAWLRLLIAAAVLWVVARPRLRGRARGDLAAGAALGVASGGLTVLFFEAIARIPLGVAATIEFLGPLAVALWGARRPRDLLWVLLAGAGVALLTLGEGSGELDPWGVALAGMAGICWAAYIVLTQRVGRLFVGTEGLAVSLAVAALVTLPAGVAAGGANLLEPWVLAAAAGLALLVPLLPYVAELEALRRLPAALFGVLMSLEPAIGALFGRLVLGQTLLAAQLLAIGLVVTASAGATLSARPPVQEPSIK